MRSPEFHFMDQFRRRQGVFVSVEESEDHTCTLDREMESLMAPRIADAAEQRAWPEDQRQLRREMLAIADRSA